MRGWSRGGVLVGARGGVWGLTHVGGCTQPWVLSHLPRNQEISAPQPGTICGHWPLGGVARGYGTPRRFLAECKWMDFSGAAFDFGSDDSESRS